MYSFQHWMMQHSVVNRVQLLCMTQLWPAQWAVFTHWFLEVFLRPYTAFHYIIIPGLIAVLPEGLVSTFVQQLFSSVSHGHRDFLRFFHSFNGVMYYKLYYGIQRILNFTLWTTDPVFLLTDAPLPVFTSKKLCLLSLFLIFLRRHCASNSKLVFF